MKCQLIQFQAGAALDQNHPLPAKLEHHIAHCDECAAWIRGQRELAAQLRQPSPLPEPPPFLQSRILRAIETKAPEAAPGWFRHAGLPAVSAALAAVLILLVRPGDPFDGWTHREPTQNKALPAGPPPAADGGRNPLVRAAITLDEPLRREFALLKQDGLNSLRALQSGFIPNYDLPENN